MATLFVAIQLVGHANGTFIEGLGTDSAKVDHSHLAGNLLGLSHTVCVFHSDHGLKFRLSMDSDIVLWSRLTQML